MATFEKATAPCALCLTPPKELLSVLVPVYNEQEVLPEFHRRLIAVLSNLDLEFEVLYVNDGSTDRSAQVLGQVRLGDHRISVLELSRNFGKEIAMAAGLDHVRGDAVVIIDADLQDAPELIPRMCMAWKNGYDQVEMRRVSREGESAVKRWTAHVFYRLIARVSDVHITEDVGDFRLLSRRAVESMRRLGERNRFMKGLYAWIGYPRVQIAYHRSPRHAGTTKWNYWRLWNFAIEGFTSFTVTPLKIASYVGFLVALIAFFYGAVVILKTLMFGDSVSGYPSLMAVLLFLGGVQLMCLGILGEYVGRMFTETKQRPLYIVSEFHPAGSKGHSFVLQTRP